MLSGERIAAAYRAACLAELAALKPGNVHVFAGGHDMTAADFEASARASAPAMGQAGITVGARILDAIRRTREVVDCNTNLGIVLLCAPLAQAALQARGGSLRNRTCRVIAGLDLADADQAFQAIRLAAPGGLGTTSRHDVSKPATATLLAAMTEARDRDRVALQYCTGYADVFERGVPWLRAARARRRPESWAVSSIYLAFLAAFPDSHVGRRHGLERAGELCRSAGLFAARMAEAEDPSTLAGELLDFDARLKADGLNPGTSADLTVASLFAAGLEDAEIELADRSAM